MKKIKTIWRIGLFILALAFGLFTGGCGAEKADILSLIHIWKNGLRAIGADQPGRSADRSGNRNRCLLYTSWKPSALKTC